MKPMSDMLRCYIARTLMQRNKGSTPPAYAVVTPYVTASCRLGFHERCNGVRAYSVDAFQSGKNQEAGQKGKNQSADDEEAGPKPGVPVSEQFHRCEIPLNGWAVPVHFLDLEGVPLANTANRTNHRFHN